MAIRVQGALDAPAIADLGSDENSLIRIACAQVLPSQESSKGDLDKLASYTREAAGRGADVIVFPEYFLSGATHAAWRDVQEQRNEQQTLSEDYISHVADLARTHDIDIVAGTIVERGGDHVPHRAEEDFDGSNGFKHRDAASQGDHDEKVFNTVYYVDRRGSVAGRYTKRRLWHPERSVLSPGHELKHEAPRTFKIRTRKGRELLAGIAVCWDLAFPETFREMMDLPRSTAGTERGKDQQLIGPDIVFAPTCWYATDSGQRGLRWNLQGEAVLLDSVCQARAIENECIVAMSNIAGPPFPANQEERQKLSDASAIGVGRTCVCAPFVGCAGRVEHADEVLLLACIDLRVLQDARDIYRQRRDLFEAWSADTQANR